jgi:DNA-binding SARP family transcriptional activator/TolB-like protein/Tfp pilus assembly protein PilF
MTLRLRLLGGFAACIDGTPERPVRVSSRKGRALLAYVAAQPEHRANREQLANLLWCDRGDALARHNLRQCLLLLRRELGAAAGDVLIVAGDEVALDSHNVTVDVRAFQSLAGSERLEDLVQATSLYRGEFLAGLSLDTDCFNDWLLGERGRLEAMAVNLLERTARLQDAAGDGAVAIAMAERLVAHDPLREDWQRLLIGLCAAHRSPEAALAHAKMVVKLLRDELDVDPAPETQALIDEVRRASLSPAAQSADRNGSPPADPSRDRPSRQAAETGRKHAMEAAAPTADITSKDHVGLPAAVDLRGTPRTHRIAAGAAAMAVVLGTAWLLHPVVASLTGSPSDQSSTQQLSEAGAPSASSWRSPLLPGAKVDGSELANRGLYAVAVLPFAVEGKTSDDDRMMAERLASGLVSDLSRAPAIRVISWHTMRQYIGQAVDVAAIGAELGVRYVVEGSIRHRQSRLQVSVSLIDARDRLQVWSDRFERDRTESGAVQDEITRSLARRMQINVLLSESRHSERAGQHDVSVGLLVAKGWGAFIESVSSGKAGPAPDHFQAALQRDPQNVSALSGLGAYHTLVAGLQLDNDRQAHLAQAESLLQKAIDKAPHLSLPYFYLGRVNKLRGRLARAHELFAKAIELNPCYAPAHAEIGQLIGLTGNPDEGLKHIRYAMRLSPRDPAAGLWNLYAGQLALEQGNDREATEWLGRAVALSPRNPMALAFLAAASALAGRQMDAAAQVAQARNIVPSLNSESIVRRLAGPADGSMKTQRLILGIQKAFQAKS